MNFINIDEYKTQLFSFRFTRQELQDIYALLNGNNEGITLGELKATIASLLEHVKE